MATLSALERRALRRARGGAMVDMNLVSLIDVFTILIFFLLSSATGVETLVSPRAVKLPQAHAEQAPHETPVIVVTADEILLDGHRIASTAEALAAGDAGIPALAAGLKKLAMRLPPRAPKAGPGAGSNAAPATGADRAVTIMGDQAIPYRLLRQVMRTCGDAGFSDVSFAVRRRIE